MKTRIFIDTNPIWDDRKAFGILFRESFADLPNFLKKHAVKNVTVCLPEIVLRERIQHKKEHVTLTLDQINKGIRSLKEAGHTDLEIEPRIDYEDQLRKSAKEFCQKHSVEIIPPPVVSVEELTERAINKIKPFDDHTSGFKDTLIYLSMIEDAKTSGADNYILCTNNTTQFDQDVIAEFEKDSGKNLIILPDILSVQQKLDELIPIGLHLEQRNSRVKNLIKNNTGELLLVANKNLARTSFSLNTWDFVAPIKLHSKLNAKSILNSNNPMFLSQSQEQDPVGCNMNDLEFLTIEELSGGEIRVHARLIVDLKYKDDDQIGMYSPLVLDRNLYRYTPMRTKSFDFTIDCNLDRSSIQIRSWD